MKDENQNVLQYFYVFVDKNPSLQLELFFMRNCDEFCLTSIHFAMLKLVFQVWQKFIKDITEIMKRYHAYINLKKCRLSFLRKANELFW